MMYASIRGADGAVLGSVAIDPTAPGGLQGALRSAFGSSFGDTNLPAQTQRGLPQAALPPRPTHMPPGPQPPTSQSRPFVCQLRFLAQLADGSVGWQQRSINCPVGLPPGVYTYQPPAGR